MKTLFAVLFLSIALPAIVFSQKASPLLKAIKKDDLPTARAFVEKGLYIAQADNKGWTPLHQVSMNFFMIELHEKQPEVYPVPKYPLEDWLSLVRLLISKKAPLDVANSDGRTPLMIALSLAPGAVSDLLLDAGAAMPTDTNYIYPAVVKGVYPIVKHFLEQGVSPEKLNRNGETMLHMAARNGNVDLVKLLLFYKANPNVLTKDGIGYYAKMSPLHMAGMFGHAEIVDLLLKSGADPNAISASGQLPLHYAACGPRLEESRQGKQSEEIFISGGNAATVKVLLTVNTDLHRRDSLGATALYWAVYYRQMESADLLLNQGATPEVELSSTPDQVFSTGLSNLWYGLHHDSLSNRIDYFEKANRFFNKADEAYQQQIDKINLKQAGRILLNVALSFAATAASTYQANLMASTSGFGYSCIQYPVISSTDLRGQKKYLKAQVKVVHKLIEWSKTAKSLHGQSAKMEVAAILNIKKDMAVE